MTEGTGDYLSLPPSPTTVRRVGTMDSNRRASLSEHPPDERSPLLQAPRSRIRIQSTHGSPRHPHLSRNQRYPGNVAPLLVLSRAPPPSPPSLRSCCRAMWFRMYPKHPTPLPRLIMGSTAVPGHLVPPGI